MIHLDTTFLVDLLREARRGDQGSATRKLEELLDHDLTISLFVLCELEAGAAISKQPEAERERIAAIVSPLAVSQLDVRLAPLYGGLLAGLQKRGEAIGSFDLLIAASALLDGAALVTRNAKHFERVPGLTVLSY